MRILTVISLDWVLRVRECVTEGEQNRIKLTVEFYAN